jgi:hypothetical protein
VCSFVLFCATAAPAFLVDPWHWPLLTGLRDRVGHRLPRTSHRLVRRADRPRGRRPPWAREALAIAKLVTFLLVTLALLGGAVAGVTLLLASRFHSAG